MSYPTVLGPWYAVQHLDSDGRMQYYTSMDEPGGTFQSIPARAMLFTSLQSAQRTALAEGAHIRVLTTKEDAEEFGRG